MRRKSKYLYLVINLTITCLKKVSYNFNLAMDVILETDIYLCVAKLIWLYYRNTHIMSIEHIHETVIYLFDNHFFKYNCFKIDYSSIGVGK